MGHLLLIQVQLFLLEELKAASGWQKNLYNTFWMSCEKTNS